MSPLIQEDDKALMLEYCRKQNRICILVLVYMTLDNTIKRYSFSTQKRSFYHINLHAVKYFYWPSVLLSKGTVLYLVLYCVDMVALGSS